MKKKLIGLWGIITGVVIAAITVNIFLKKAIWLEKKQTEKFRGYYNMLNQWLTLRQQGKNLAKYFTDNGYQTIAIYGMGEMGKQLYDDLKESAINVKYAIDKNSMGISSELKIIHVDDFFSPVDAIIVTAIFAFDEIENELHHKIDCPIISLDDVVFDI